MGASSLDKPGGGRETQVASTPPWRCSGWFERASLTEAPSWGAWPQARLVMWERDKMSRPATWVRTVEAATGIRADELRALVRAYTNALGYSESKAARMCVIAGLLDRRNCQGAILRWWYMNRKATPPFAIPFACCSSASCGKAAVRAGLCRGHYNEHLSRRGRKRA